MNGTDEFPADAPADAAPVAKRQADGQPLGRGKRSGAADRVPVTIDAAGLFAGGNEVRLLHRGQEYRLRVTRQGKLILTK